MRLPAEWPRATLRFEGPPEGSGGNQSLSVGAEKGDRLPWRLFSALHLLGRECTQEQSAGEDQRPPGLNIQHLGPRWL